MNHKIISLVALIGVHASAQDLPPKYQAIANAVIQQHYSLPHSTDEAMLKEYGVSQINFVRLLRQEYSENQIRNLAHLQPAFRVIWHKFMPTPMPLFLGTDYGQLERKR